MEDKNLIFESNTFEKFQKNNLIVRGLKNEFYYIHNILEDDGTLKNINKFLLLGYKKEGNELLGTEIKVEYIKTKISGIGKDKKGEFEIDGVLYYCGGDAMDGFKYFNIKKKYKLLKKEFKEVKYEKEKNKINNKDNSFDFLLEETEKRWNEYKLQELKNY
jgi:hypothetical protein